MFFAYVIQNQEGILYKGHTTDLKSRVEMHNIGNEFSRYTKNRGPWKLVYFEEFQTATEAIIRESFFKSRIRSSNGAQFVNPLFE